MLINREIAQQSVRFAIRPRSCYNYRCMSSNDPLQARVGAVRLCPHCGTRVAQKAQTCFFCGALLDNAPQRRFHMPWADLILFAVIGTVLTLWWLRAPQMSIKEVAADDSPSSAVVAALTPPALAALIADDVATATPVPPTAVPTDTPSPTATLPAEPPRYTVKAGDTVDAIARQFNSTIADIIQANGLGANARLNVGQVLIVPVPGGTGGAGPTATPTGDMLIYSVQAGDTVSGIAEKFNSRIDWILQANKMDGSAILRIGQSLLVPLSPMTPTPSPTPNVTPQPPTPTPVPTLGAPALLSPADGSIVTGQEAVLLSWTSVGTLGADEWYVVIVRKSGSLTPLITWWSKNTTWRLPATYRDPSGTDTDIIWRVQVRKGSPDNAGEPISPASVERRFTWR